MMKPNRQHGRSRVKYSAEYVRMSPKEHQEYSSMRQLDCIREYAKKRGLIITKEFPDDEKSSEKP